MSELNEMNDMIDMNDKDRNIPWGIIIILVLFFLLFFAGMIWFILSPSGPPHLVGTEQELENSVPYLIYETNFPDKAKKCTVNKTYGITDDGEFYVKDGCSGIFLYRDEKGNEYIGPCTTSRLGKKRCAIGKMDPDISPIDTKRVGDPENPIHVVPREDPLNTNLNGLIQKVDDQIIVMRQNGKCDPENYGFYGNNMIYTENGCDGVFRIGTLIGECSSSESKDGKTRTLCPIGWKQENHGKQMGLVLTDLTAMDRTERCQSAPNAYGIRDSRTGFRDPNACKGDMVFRSNLQDNLLYANYEVKCDPNLAECDLSVVAE
jgi:hypothetical protein